MPLARRRRRGVDIWPGFVDALATVLMVMIFVLMVFVLSQFFLNSALSGSEQANSALSQQLIALAEQLSLTKKANTDLAMELDTTKADATTKQASLDDEVAKLREELSRIAEALNVSEQQVSDQKTRYRRAFGAAGHVLHQRQPYAPRPGLVRRCEAD